MRKKLIAANWKMYKTPEQTTAFFTEFLPMVADHDRDEIVVCPPFVDLHAAVEAAAGSNVAVGAQNVHWEKEGAFTGEISVVMLAAIGVTHVIIGHSERRQYFNETDDTVNRKLKTALENGFTPIVCIGEVLEEREAGLTEDVLRRQCTRAFHGISAKKAARAYHCLRAGVGDRHGQDGHAADGLRRAPGHSPRGGEGLRQGVRGGAADSLRRQRQAGQCSALMGEEEIDGALVGGASLDAAGFSKIVKY